MIGTSRLGYALAADGLFPKLFAKIHDKIQNTIRIRDYPKCHGSCRCTCGATLWRLKPAYFGLSVFLGNSASGDERCSVSATQKEPCPKHVYGKSKMVIPVLGIVFSHTRLLNEVYPTLPSVYCCFGGNPNLHQVLTKEENLPKLNKCLFPQNIFRRIYRQEHVFLAHLLHHLRNSSEITKKTRWVRDSVTLNFRLYNTLMEIFKCLK